jgi:hypothetical protein
VYLNRKEQWNKKIWIAKQIPNELDEYGRAKYEEPEMFEMNVQPVSAEADIQEFGQSARQMQKALIEYDKYFGKFKEFDVAYLDGITPEGEKVNGSKANYRLYPPRNQNRCITLYFERLIKK